MKTYSKGTGGFPAGYRTGGCIKTVRTKAMRIITILVAVFLVGCSTSGKWSKVIRYPERSPLDWQPDRAEAEAKKDIAAGKAKIYLNGGIAPMEVGLSLKEQGLVEDLPLADAGTGCVVTDQDLRNAQAEYAHRYNRYVVEHLPNR
jgi:hypothetical protein